MLDKSKLIYLNKNERYTEIYEMFGKEYIELLKQFFDKNGIEYIEKGPIFYYIQILQKEKGKQYSDVINILINMFEDEENSIHDSIYAAIDSYNYVKKRLKET